MGRFLLLCPKRGEATARCRPGASSANAKRPGKLYSHRNLQSSESLPRRVHLLFEAPLDLDVAQSWGMDQSRSSCGAADRTVPASSSPGASSATFITWPDLDSEVQRDGQYADKYQFSGQPK